MVRRFYRSLRRNAEWQVSTPAEGLREVPLGAGDWLALTEAGNDEVIGSAHFARSLKLMAELATEIGKARDA
jgi:hypothetical protein